MNFNEALVNGTTLMLVGMGTVFSFLCIMVFAMSIMSKVVAKLNLIWPEPVAQIAGTKKVKTSSNDEEIAAAIIAAMFKKN
ncbi:MAG: OadG family protein [bacterium]|nr:OadG family protein [bacterium]